MTIAVCISCGAFKHGAFSPCEKCGATPKSDEDKAVSIAASDWHCDQATLKRISEEVQAGWPATVDERIVRENLEMIQSDAGRSVMGIYGPDAGSGQIAGSVVAGKAWVSDPESLLAAVSELMGSGITRFALIDKETGLTFLRMRGYKKPFLAPTNGTIRMLLERYPHYFVGFYRYIWIGDLAVHSSNVSQDEKARNTWNLEGRRIDLDRQIPLGAYGKTVFHLAQPFFVVMIPDIRARFGSLLQPSP